MLLHSTFAGAALLIGVVTSQAAAGEITTIEVEATIFVSRPSSPIHLQNVARCGSTRYQPKPPMDPGVIHASRARRPPPSFSADAAGAYEWDIRADQSKRIPLDLHQRGDGKVRAVRVYALV